jgi:Na+-transporting methylmalonyl-CoA/oxaloacetate decarboxylase beta subunit
VVADGGWVVELGSVVAIGVATVGVGAVVIGPAVVAGAVVAVVEGEDGEVAAVTELVGSLAPLELTAVAPAVSAPELEPLLQPESPTTKIQTAISTVRIIQ